MAPRAKSASCPDCGMELPSDASIEGLCPKCLLSLALMGSEVEENPTLDGSGLGRVLGERYQIREVLGRGGMGEVFRAFDLKLRVDVALKALLAERLSSARARELLRQEVRSAREVVSPNVCRIFDLVVDGERELVSMEYIDGTTLAETLRERGPLALQEAREIASQFLSGLDAIHQAGLVHRDFKPENVMLTRVGRVVVMDFGLAKGRTEESTGTISGTPAYMAPEQARGEAVDARADVFSAGVVLAEMLTSESRQELWRAVRESPPRVPEGPWSSVLKKALAREPDSRHASARALARALEEVTLRLPGFEDKEPYPGLASFRAEDAEYFFGREVEVEAVWKKLKRPRLLALIGPSGAGKSSFLKAGLLPSLPSSYRAVLCTPGNRPFQSLARALVPVFSGDTEATEELLRFEEDGTAVSLLSRWRSRHEQALVILDQFEELFTLNAPEVQEAFAKLLGKLVLEADVHVLLSLRDDFLFHCQAHEALAPVFSELTPLGPLNESSLRRALVQPALACGYRFEDEALVEEMVSEVRRERGALPLLAFAASRLWEKRDRENGLLTREAYREIGGVGGALAQHAEETLERIGTEKTPVVRELFRNLVTAQGTRASRDVSELLSIFPKEDEHRAAEEVLQKLVASRLLTAYETSVEIIHESLLSAWPRLVRWQTQDADGAQIRDQLRQAAQAWQDRGRSEDLLWTGSSYREFALWRERYSGGLTSTEEAFAEAATRLAGRRRRRRRIATAAVVGIAFGVASLTSLLWRRATLEAQRREAAQILALGRLKLEDYPAAAVAYALASLERADTQEARRFALEAMSRGPAAFVLPGDGQGVDFSGDGRWLATSGLGSGIRLWSREGGAPISLGTVEDYSGVRLDPENDLLSVRGGGTLRIFSVPDGKEVQKFDIEGFSDIEHRGSRVFTFTDTGDGQTIGSVPLGEGKPRVMGHWDNRNVSEWDVSPDGAWLAYARERTVYLLPLEHLESTPRVLGQHSANVVSVSFQTDSDRLVSSDESGEIRIWSLETQAPAPLRTIQAATTMGILCMDASGSTLVAAQGAGLAISTVASVWDLNGPPDADPLILRKGDATNNWLALERSGLWLATAHHYMGVNLWALGGEYPRILRGQSPPFIHVAFTPDGNWLVSSSYDGTVRLWPLRASVAPQQRILLEEKGAQFRVAVAPTGGNVLTISRFDGRVFLIPFDGGKPRLLSSPSPGEWGAPAFSADGRLAAVRTFRGPKGALIEVFDLHSGGVQALDPRIGDEDCGWGKSFEGLVDDARFTSDGRLLTAGVTGLRLWNLESGTSTLLRPCKTKTDPVLGGSSADRFLLAEVNGEQRSSVTIFFDLRRNTSRELTSHGSRVLSVALDPKGEIAVTGNHDGVVRVGPVTGEEPHLLYGHTLEVSSVAVSPDGQWIASGSQDGTIRLWPMPKGKPFHTLPYEEILERLRSFTNLRVVRDEGTDTGYRVEAGPFPGWAKHPER